MKPIFCFILAMSAAQGAPRSFSPKTPANTPLKALPVVVQPATEKIYVSTSGATAQPAKAAKSTTPKVVQPHALAPNPWHVTPKFEKGGKADSTFGLMLNHRF